MGGPFGRHGGILSSLERLSTGFRIINSAMTVVEQSVEKKEEKKREKRAKDSSPIAESLYP